MFLLATASFRQGFFCYIGLSCLNSISKQTPFLCTLSGRFMQQWEMSQILMRYRLTNVDSHRPRHYAQRQPVKQHSHITQQGESRHSGPLTCMWFHRKVRLPLQDAIYQFGTVSINRIICISGRHFSNVST